MKKLMVLSIALTFASCSSITPTNNMVAMDEVAAKPMTEMREPAAATVRNGTSYDYLSETGNRVAVLDRCKGTATLARNNGFLVLKVRGASCSNLVTNAGAWKLEGKGSVDRHIDVNLNESIPGWHDVLIGSNDYVASRGADGNGDKVSVYIPKRENIPTIRVSRGSNQFINLDDCNGTVTARLTEAGTVKVIFSNVAKCSRYDVTKNNNDTINMPEVEMYGDNGEINLGSNVFEYGKNVIEIRFFKRGAREDKVRIQFDAR